MKDEYFRQRFLRVLEDSLESWLVPTQLRPYLTGLRSYVPSMPAEEVERLKLFMPAREEPEESE